MGWWLVDHLYQEVSEYGDFKLMVEITLYVITATGIWIQLLYTWNYGLPQPQNLYSYLVVCIQFPDLPGQQGVGRCWQLIVWMVHSECCYTLREMWRILEIELHFSVFIISHVCIYLEYIHVMNTILHLPQLELPNHVRKLTTRTAICRGDAPA